MTTDVVATRFKQFRGVRGLSLSLVGVVGDVPGMCAGGVEVHVVRRYWVRSLMKARPVSLLGQALTPASHEAYGHKFS